MKLYRIIMALALLGSSGLFGCSWRPSPPKADLTGFDQLRISRPPRSCPSSHLRLAVAKVDPIFRRNDDGSGYSGQVALRLSSIGQGIREQWLDESSRLDRLYGVMLLDPQRDRFDGTERGLVDLARNHGADLLLVYHMHTRPGQHDHIGTPIFTILTLGLLPNIIANADADADSRLIDTRTGCVYQSLEESYHAWQPAIAITADDADRDVMERAPERCARHLARSLVENWSKAVLRPLDHSAATALPSRGSSSPSPPGVRYETR